MLRTILLTVIMPSLAILYTAAFAPSSVKVAVLVILVGELFILIGEAIMIPVKRWRRG